jgi:hypothetical protein
MRRVRCVLVGLAVLTGLPVPAAHAQFPSGPVPQDLSITGEIVGRDGMKVRTVRFTVTNHGPGALDGPHVQIAPATLEAVIRSASPGCGQTFPGYRCELGTHLEPGEARSADITYEYVSTEYRSTAVQGILVVSNEGLTPVGDANPANDRVAVDLDPERGPPAIAVGIGVGSSSAHGAPVRTSAFIRNSGGTRLTGVRLTLDRCPESAQQNVFGRTDLGLFTGITINCTWTAPPHVRGDAWIKETATVTATAPDGTVVSATATRLIGFREPERKCGSFRARGRTYDVKTNLPDISCAATRRALKRCRTRHKRPKGFRCDVSKTGRSVIVGKLGNPTARMLAVARRR